MKSLWSTIKRFFQHACVMPWQVRRAFPASVCQFIEQTITVSEQGRRTEIRFVVEAALDAGQLWRKLSARQRAVELFSALRIWDTEYNSGVLVYVLFAERQIEIVADRGISSRVSQAEWDVISAHIVNAFQRGHFEFGAIDGLKRITALLDQHFPNPVDKQHNELPNRVILI